MSSDGFIVDFTLSFQTDRNDVDQCIPRKKVTWKNVVIPVVAETFKTKVRKLPIDEDQSL